MDHEYYESSFIKAPSVSSVQRTLSVERESSTPTVLRGTTHLKVKVPGIHDSQDGSIEFDCKNPHDPARQTDGNKQNTGKDVALHVQIAYRTRCLLQSSMYDFFTSTSEVFEQRYRIMCGGAASSISIEAQTQLCLDLRSRIGAGRFRSYFEPVHGQLYSDSARIGTTDLLERLVGDTDQGASISLVSSRLLGATPSTRVSALRNHFCEQSAHPLLSWLEHMLVGLEQPPDILRLTSPEKPVDGPVKRELETASVERPDTC